MSLRSGEKVYVGGVLRRVLEVRGSRVLMSRAGLFLNRSLFHWDDEDRCWYYG